jgi:dTDP-4-dehydrorhamnose reductase
LDKRELDITSLEQVRKIIMETQPDIILNCAAYTNVDEAEESGKLLNFQVNALGVYHLAKITKERGVDLITISTDYVFDGNKSD